MVAKFPVKYSHILLILCTTGLAFVFVLSHIIALQNLFQLHCLSFLFHTQICVVPYQRQDSLKIKTWWHQNLQILFTCLGQHRGNGGENQCVQNAKDECDSHPCLHMDVISRSTKTQPNNAMKRGYLNPCYHQGVMSSQSIIFILARTTSQHGNCSIHISNSKTLSNLME